MNCSIIEAATASVDIYENAGNSLSIAEAQPCAITVVESDQPLITLQQPTAALMSVVSPTAASLTITQPTAVPTIVLNDTGVVVTAFAQREYLGAVPVYSGGTLVRVNYSDGTAKTFELNTGYLAHVNYLAPNQPTLRKTITWSGGVWQGTSVPVVI